MKELLDCIEKYKNMILEAERYIWKHPETGYREVNTSAYMAERFRELGYENLVMAGNIPGFYTVVDTGREGPEVLVLAEMDSLVCPNHKECDPKTGYVHACGHHAQCAAMLGIAASLKEEKVLSRLCGRVRLCVVPAEELIEIEYRNELKKQGIIKYFGGKGEFLYRGYFDGVDLAFMVHTSTGTGVGQGAIGCVAKKIKYKGVSAHAGGSPELGINALYAATQGLSAANALRETFKETDLIRFHPIITHGGEVVNAIPETVTIESFVRGATFEAIMRENKKINRALCGAAVSMGANVEIEDFPGYAPLKNDKGMLELSSDAARIAMPEINYPIGNDVGRGSTDMGELCGLMPVVHPYVAGASGKVHGDDFCISDPYTACVVSAKWQLAMIILLLENGGERAKKIKANYKSQFASKEEYFSYIEGLNSQGDKIIYNDDGSITIKQ
ncbi:MAG: amidohydrolase [Clostridia bacterium]|nr:amidohydrolase [Clostridia bacterium]